MSKSLLDTFLMTLNKQETLIDESFKKALNEEIEKALWRIEDSMTKDLGYDLPEYRQQVRVVMTAAGYYTFKNCYFDTETQELTYTSNDARTPISDDINGLRRQLEDLTKALDMPVLEDK